MFGSCFSTLAAILVLDFKKMVVYTFIKYNYKRKWISWWECIPLLDCQAPAFSVCMCHSSHPPGLILLQVPVWVWVVRFAKDWLTEGLTCWLHRSFAVAGEWQSLGARPLPGVDWWAGVMWRENKGACDGRQHPAPSGPVHCGWWSSSSSSGFHGYGRS